MRAITAMEIASFMPCFDKEFGSSALMQGKYNKQRDNMIVVSLFGIKN